MIYATRVSSPSGKYNSRFRAVLLAAALCGAFSESPAAQPGPAWREAPEFLQPFAPAGARRAAYRAFVSSSDLDAALAQLNLGGAATTSTAWMPAPVAPADAFGQAGTYDRSSLARLYGSRRPRVARGVTTAGGQREMWTLISPYPDAALRRLENGTLLLVLRYDPAHSGR